MQHVLLLAVCDGKAISFDCSLFNKNQVFERGMIQILDQSKASVSKLFSITTTAIRHAMSEKQCTKSGYLKNRH